MTIRATLRGPHDGLLPPLAVPEAQPERDSHGNAPLLRHQVLVLPLATGPAGSGGAPRASGVTRVEVVVDGWRFEVDVEDERRAALREGAARARADAGQSGPVDVRAIIPGVVVSVAVAAGDEVAAGQELLVVEAMKMQNELRAPRAGTVARVTVGERSTIEVGDVLVVIE